MPRSSRNKRGGQRLAQPGRVYVGDGVPLPPLGGQLCSSDDMKDFLRNKSLQEQERTIQDFLAKQVAPADREFLSNQFIMWQFEVASYFSTYIQALEARNRQEYRRACDLYWKAFEAATSQSLWSPGRIEIFDNYVRVPWKHPEIVAKKDYQRIKAIIYDPAELAYLRLAASIYIQLLPDSRHLSHEEKLEIQREALLIEATPDELSRKVAYADDKGPNTKVVQDLFDFARESAVGDFTKNQYLQGIVFSNERFFGSMELVPQSVDAELFRRTSEFGGMECDFCHKTVQELGVTTLKSCSRCKAAYYCGTECQTTAWKMGHKGACRSPKSRQVGDLMRIQGLKNRPELNGRLVRLWVPEFSNETTVTADRWQVSLFAEHEEGDDMTKAFSVDAKNLLHIRPAK